MWGVSQGGDSRANGPFFGLDAYLACKPRHTYTVRVKKQKTHDTVHRFTQRVKSFWNHRSKYTHTCENPPVCKPPRAVLHCDKRTRKTLPRHVQQKAPWCVRTLLCTNPCSRCDRKAPPESLHEPFLRRFRRIPDYPPLPSPPDNFNSSLHVRRLPTARSLLPPPPPPPLLLPISLITLPLPSQQPLS